MIRASWICLRVRPRSSVVAKLFPSGTAFPRCPSFATSPLSWAASYSSASVVADASGCAARHRGELKQPEGRSPLVRNLHEGPIRGCQIAPDFLREPQGFIQSCRTVGQIRALVILLEQISVPEMQEVLRHRLLQLEHTVESALRPLGRSLLSQPKADELPLERAQMPPPGRDRSGVALERHADGPPRGGLGLVRAQHGAHGDAAGQERGARSGHAARDAMSVHDLPSATLRPEHPRHSASDLGGPR